MNWTMVLIFLLSSFPIGVFGASFIEENINYILHHTSFQLPATTHARIRLPPLLGLPCHWLAVFGRSRAGESHFVEGSVEGEQL